MLLLLQLGSMYDVLGSHIARLGNSFLSALPDFTYLVELHTVAAGCIRGEAMEQYNAEGRLIVEPPFPKNNVERNGGGGGGTSDETLVEVPAQLLVPAVSQILSASVELRPNLLRGRRAT